MEPKKLGFGLMRLPLADPENTASIDHAAVCRMADRFLAEGFAYFDTAAPYHGKFNSELAFGQCVASRHPRESYRLTDKLSFFMVQQADQLEDFFAGQLERCGVDYFDCYLLHAMDADRLALAERIGAFEFVAQKKAEGKVRRVGFSFHDSPEVLERFLTRHPEMEVVQLQLNYLDWEDPEVQARRCYEVCRRHGKPVIVMEPVKGGLLASLPPKAEALLKAAAPQASAASWAVRFAASLEGVEMVLSGMSSEEQLADNLGYMKDFAPLTAAERQLTEQAAGIIKNAASVPCTACRYCVDGCPQKIAIPEIFKLVNKVSRFGKGQLPAAKNSYAQLAQSHGKASDCIRCGQCEAACPQHLPVTKHLEEAARLLE